MSTEPTPVQLRPRHSNTSLQNLDLCQEQLRAAGVEEWKILRFRSKVNEIRGMQGYGPGPLNTAAEELGFEVHWIN